MGQMNQKNALDFINKIVEDCEKAGIWVDVNIERKPFPLKINLNISVKIDRDKTDGKAIILTQKENHITLVESG